MRRTIPLHKRKRRFCARHPLFTLPFLLNESKAAFQKKGHHHRRLLILPLAPPSFPPSLPSFLASYAGWRVLQWNIIIYGYDHGMIRALCPFKLCNQARWVESGRESSRQKADEGQFRYDRRTDYGTMEFPSHLKWKGTRTTLEMTLSLLQIHPSEIKQESGEPGKERDFQFETA